jgi:hypothetical protein
VKFIKTIVVFAISVSYLSRIVIPYPAWGDGKEVGQRVSVLNSITKCNQ